MRTTSRTTAMIAVPFEAPSSRALAASQRTALAGVVATLIIAAGPLLITFFASGDLSQTALKTLALGLAGTLLTAILAYAQKFTEASREAVNHVAPGGGPPTPSPLVDPPAPVTPEQPVVPVVSPIPPVQPPAMPPIIDPQLVTQLIEQYLRQSLVTPAAPLASAYQPVRTASGQFGHRVVAEPVAPVQPV